MNYTLANANVTHFFICVKSNASIARNPSRSEPLEVGRSIAIGTATRLFIRQFICFR